MGEQVHPVVAIYQIDTSKGPYCNYWKMTSATMILCVQVLAIRPNVKRAIMIKKLNPSEENKKKKGFIL